MAEHFGFFNARRNEDGTLDRRYDANDYCDNLAFVIGNGVLRSTGDDLKVTASGMLVTVAAGRAWINGHYYINDSPFTFAAVNAPIGGKRWDRIFLRMSKEINDRSVALVYEKGEEANTPVKPSPIRTNNIHDIVLADIYVDTNASSLQINDTRDDADLCGWVYSTRGNESFFTTLDNNFNEWFGEKKDTLSSVTLFKRYTWRTVLEIASQAVKFDIPQWDSETCFLEVYVNGVLEHEGVNYTHDKANSIIRFTNSLIIGTEIIVKVYKSIDGTGIESVADEITALQNQVAALRIDSAMTYVCNGLNDNIGISEMAQAFLDGTGAFANSDADAQLTIKVCGRFGATRAYSGNGTTLNPSVWFAIGRTSAKRVVVDFANCEKVSISLVPDTTNTIFGGQNCCIKNANVLVSDSGVGASVMFFDGTGDVAAHDCRMTANVKGFAVVSYAGTFRDCTTLLMAGGNAISFYGANGKNAILIDGGSHKAYTKGATNISAVVYSGGADTTAIVMVSGAKFPALAMGDYKQHDAISFAAGYISGSGNITTLPISIAASAHSTLTGTIPLNKE